MTAPALLGHEQREERGGELVGRHDDLVAGARARPATSPSRPTPRGCGDRSAASAPISVAKSARRRSGRPIPVRSSCPGPACQAGASPPERVDGGLRRQAVRGRVEIGDARRRRNRERTIGSVPGPPPARWASATASPRAGVPAGGRARVRTRRGRPHAPGDLGHAQPIFPPPKLMQWVLRWVNVWSASTPRSSPRPDILWPSYGTLTGR